MAEGLPTEGKVKVDDTDIEKVIAYFFTENNTDIESVNLRHSSDSYKSSASSMSSTNDGPGTSHDTRFRRSTSQNALDENGVQTVQRDVAPSTIRNNSDIELNLLTLEDPGSSDLKLPEELPINEAVGDIRDHATLENNKLVKTKSRIKFLKWIHRKKHGKGSSESQRFYAEQLQLNESALSRNTPKRDHIHTENHRKSASTRFKNWFGHKNN